MSRTKTFANLLWIGTAAIGCGDDGVKHLGDAPPMSIDAAVDAAPAPIAMFAASAAGEVTCGDLTRNSFDVMVTNVGQLELQITDLAMTGGFELTADLVFPIAIAPGASTTIGITPPLAVLGTDLAGIPKVGVLTMTTNEATPSHTIDLSAQVKGANLVFTDMADVPITPSFVSTDGACPAPVTIKIHNTGNLDTTVTFENSTHYVLQGFSSGTLSAGSSAEETIRPYTLGDLTCATTESITYHVSGNLCNGDSSGFSIDLATNLSITGGGTSCFCS